MPRWSVASSSMGSYSTSSDNQARPGGLAGLVGGPGTSARNCLGTPGGAGRRTGAGAAARKLPAATAANTQ
eukprot:4912057-Alexandrium_andersonii.AAC.1